ncbi:MAG: hypothetical protein V3T86_14440, partial [Planctomycetota bacterium]
LIDDVRICRGDEPIIDRAALTEELLTDLIGDVLGLNLANGIENNLDAKLDKAFDALFDSNNGNDGAAVHALEAFIQAVFAQASLQWNGSLGANKISVEDGYRLIAKADELIVLIETGCIGPICIG